MNLNKFGPVVHSPLKPATTSRKDHFKVTDAILQGLQNNRGERKIYRRCIAGLQLTSRQPCWWIRAKRFPSLGTELFYHANSAKFFFIVLSPNMAALSRGCKPRIEKVGSLTLDNSRKVDILNFYE